MTIVIPLGRHVRRRPWAAAVCRRGRAVATGASRAVRFIDELSGVARLLGLTLTATVALAVTLLAWSDPASEGSPVESERPATVEVRYPDYAGYGPPGCRCQPREGLPAVTAGE